MVSIAASGSTLGACGDGVVVRATVARYV